MATNGNNSIIIFSNWFALLINFFYRCTVFHYGENGRLVR
jgi:hypothetical protein